MRICEQGNKENKGPSASSIASGIGGKGKKNLKSTIPSPKTEKDLLNGKCQKISESLNIRVIVKVNSPVKLVGKKQKT